MARFGNVRRGSFGFLGVTGATGSTNADMGGTNFGLTSPGWGNTASPSSSKSLATVGSTSNPIQLPTTTITTSAPGKLFGLSMVQLVVIGVALGLAAIVIFSGDHQRKA